MDARYNPNQQSLQNKRTKLESNNLINSNHVLSPTQENQQTGQLHKQVRTMTSLKSQTRHLMMRQTFQTQTGVSPQ